MRYVAPNQYLYFFNYILESLKNCLFWHKTFTEATLKVVLFIQMVIIQERTRDGGEVGYNKNPCAWLFWHSSSRGNLALCHQRGRLGSWFNCLSEDQCQRSHSKWVFVFIPPLKSKYSQIILSKLSKFGDLSSTIAMTVYCFGALSVRLGPAWLIKTVTYFDLIG